ncbi:MAG: type II toxin-antitoxin system VapC family toxin [Candidatus Sumerlaeota bacterium]|nr:type II toxin-antitoxin system VapC family toxin [Candidatus Sumerlaeota bacterium]
MIALDTNILVRLLLQDDQAQLAAIVSFLEGHEGERYWVSDIVWAEVVWTLLRGARWRPAQVAAALRRVAERADVLFEDWERFDGAVKALDEGGDFADRLIVEAARKQGCSRLLSLDRALLERHPDFVTKP